MTQVKQGAPHRFYEAILVIKNADVRNYADLMELNPIELRAYRNALTKMLEISKPKEAS